MRNKQYFIVFILISFLISGCCTPQQKTFVRTHDGQIYIGANKVRLIGANIPFWNRRWEKVSLEDLKQDIEKIKEIGNTVRIDINYGGEELGHFGTNDARLLDKLEYFAKEAQKQGVVVIVTKGVLNYFEIESYKKFMQQVLDRLKDYKNIIYDIQNEPDNEARLIPSRRATIVNWCNQMAEFIKNNDAGQHLVTIGFSGIDFIVSGEINLENIDIVCFHLGTPSRYLLKRRVRILRDILKQRGYVDMPIAIEEVALASKDFAEEVRAEKLQNLYDTAKSLDVDMFLWWCLRDVPMDPNTIDGDRISTEPHTCGIFNADFSRKQPSTEVAIGIGKEASKINFE